MTNEELYLEMQKSFAKIDDKFARIEGEFAKINRRLDKLDEDAEVTRAGVNTLLDWADQVGNALSFPLPRIAE